MWTRLIRATTTTPAADAQTALDAYANAVREQLPDFWQPSPGTLLRLPVKPRGRDPQRLWVPQPRGVVLHEVSEPSVTHSVTGCRR